MGFSGAFRSWRRSGGPPERLFRRALRHLLSGRDDEAERDLTAIVRNDTSEVEAYLGLAEIYRRRGDVGRAISMYQNLNLRNDLGEEQREAVLCGLGLAFETGGFVPRAIATFEQVLDRSRDHEVALAALIRLLPGQGDHERALVHQRRLNKRHGERDRAVEAAILVEIAQKRLGESREDMARKSARRAVRLGGPQADAHLVLARIESNAQHPKRVVTHLISALDAAPDQADEILGLLEEAWPSGAGRRGDWLEYLRDSARRHADEPRLVDALARAMMERERTDEALEVLRAGLIRWPDETRLHMRVGRILLAGGQYDEALSAYESLLDQLEKKQGGDT